MTRANRLLFGAIVLTVMLVVGVISASVMAATGRVGLPSMTRVFAATSPSATHSSNEAAAHEAGEPAARETAENNGTFLPGAFGPGPGHSNETATHEAGEPATREAAENSATGK